LGRNLLSVPLRHYALRKKTKFQKPKSLLCLLVDKSRVARFTRYKSKIKTRHAQGGNGQWSREAYMLERSAGLRYLSRADALLWRAGCIGFLFLELGGCMTLGENAPPPPVADSTPQPPDAGGAASFVNAAPPTISTPAVTQPAKLAQGEKKRERRAQHASQVASAARASQVRAPSVDPGRLIGMAPKAVRELLGPPVRVESYDLSREWVYASNGCSFRVFFYPNLNTAAFRVLKYGGNDGNGELMDVSDVCIRHILTARKNATG
jgi:hypothetical protein